MKNEAEFSKFVRSIINGHGGHVSQVEAHASAAGIPDLDYCIEGKEGHIELKYMSINHVPRIRPSQFLWMKKRMAAGGTPFFLCYDFDDHMVFVVTDSDNKNMQGKVPWAKWNDMEVAKWSVDETKHKLIEFLVNK